MTKNHKFMLSMATIAILSGTAFAEELKITSDELKLGDTKVEITDGIANVTPSETKQSDAITIKNTISGTIGADTMTQLNITAKDAALNIGATSQNAEVTIGGTKNSSAGAYGFDFDTKSLKVDGKANKTTQLNVNADSVITTTDGATLNANSAINIAKDATLEVNGKLTTANGDIDLGGGTLRTNGEFSAGKINLNGGTLTANGKSTLDGTKLTLTNGGTLNFFGTGAEKASTISGKVESVEGKALNINLASGAEVTFSDTTNGLNLKNNTETARDIINLNGGTLKVGKLTAAGTNLNTYGGGTIEFTDTGSAISGDLTLGSGTTLKFTDGKSTSFDTLDTNGGSLDVAGGSIDINKELNAFGSDLNFGAKGGTITLKEKSKGTIKGDLELGDKAKIVISSAAGLSVDKLSLTKGEITFSDTSNLYVYDGLITEDAATNLKVSEGGNINFNGGLSEIKGKLATTDNKKLTLDVNQNAGVSFEDLELKEGSVLSLSGGVVDITKLKTNKADNLSLKNGTLNFNDSGTGGKSELAGLTIDENSAATLNFNDKAVVELKDDNIDLGKGLVSFNLNKGSKVTMSDTNKELKAKNLNFNGGTLNLKKLIASKTASTDTLNLNFANAGVVLKGTLQGDNEFDIGTDENGNSFIGEASKEVKFGSDSSLALNYGTITTSKMTTEKDKGKLIFGGGSLNIDDKGKLTIADASKNLEFKDGAGGLITIKGDGTSGGDLTISDGNLDLSKTSYDIKIEKGGKFSATKSIISGNGNTIYLGNYANIRLKGDILSASSEFSDLKMGDVKLGKNAILNINTYYNDSGELQDISAGKLSADTGGTAILAFGNGGVVKLTGATIESTKLNSAGFGDKVTLGKNAVLEFASGIVDVKGALAVETNNVATLKVSNSVANLNGGFDSSNYVKTIELDRGALNIKQETFTGISLYVTHIQQDASGISSALNVEGIADIKTSKFAILPLVDTGATSYKVISASKELKTDTLNDKSGTTGEFRVRNSLNGILAKYGLEAKDSKGAVTAKDGDKVISVQDTAVNATLRQEGNSLILERTFDVSSLAKIKEDKINADVALLTAMDKDTTIVNKSGDLKNTLSELQARQTAAKGQSNAELANELGGANSDILLSAFGTKAGALSDETKNAVALDIINANASGANSIVKDIKDGAQTAVNFASSTASVMNTINLSNDMAISGRIAKANNPYADLAQGFAGQTYAAVDGDLPLYYANNGYANGFWANAIGGLNRIDGESGKLIGLSVGFDRQLENTLVGFYASYTDAALNDKIVKQDSDNIQAGAYLSFNQRDIEVNVKAYGQVSITETEAKRGAQENIVSAKFNRLYGGLSANVGAIFAVNNNKTFIKPFVGENYYYAHTPAYKEGGDKNVLGALDIQSTNNHALSFDVGVDVRHYFNQNSFLYVTPSVERYVVNVGGDFTAGFIGSDTTFTIEGKSKTKTYLQALIGGNIALGDKFNVNVGVGAKKIVSGQVTYRDEDNQEGKKDELYLSGNIGFKYRF